MQFGRADLAARSGDLTHVHVFMGTSRWCAECHSTACGADLRRLRVFYSVFGAPSCMKFDDLSGGSTD